MRETFSMACSSPSLVTIACLNHRRGGNINTINLQRHTSTTTLSSFSLPSIKHKNLRLQVLACSSPPHPQKSTTSTNTTNFTSSSKKLYVSGLSFRTSEESLRNAFQSFGQLVEVNLVMDKIANRPRGFAFLRYATNEESDKAIEGMHGKFLDGRVIFVEYAKPRSQLQQGIKQDSKPYR